MNEAGAGYLGGIESEVMAEWRRRSRNALYREDPEAWLWDVLRRRWHAKQREFVHGFLENRRTAFKSSNGVGKSVTVSDLQTWGIATHEPGELLIIQSAPTARQIEETSFALISANYGRARVNGHTLPGNFSQMRLSWQPDPQTKARTLMLGQKPSDTDIVGSFQGIRAIGEDVKTWVFIEEAGAVHKDLFVGAESVTTGAGDNKIAVIGNPDNLGTYFHSIFTNPKIKQDWFTMSTAAHELPTFTGEIVYEDPEQQRAMLHSGMADREWVEQKKRAWGEDSARYKSKVLGEFPDVDDHSFFSQSAIDTAYDTSIPFDTHAPMVHGVDLARYGEDDSMVYSNCAGRVRFRDSWSQASANESATRAHTIALEDSVTAMVIDAAGLGGPILDQIAARADRHYTVIPALGANKSPDLTRWLNARAYWYDQLRQGMMTGQIDLDPEDERLKEELLAIRYDFTDRGAIKIESKKDMAKRGVKSPDALDAVVYSIVNAVEIMEDPLSGLSPGDVVQVDPWAYMDGMAGLPI